MRVFGALVWREIAERRLLLLASVFLGIVPLVLPFVPGRPERFTPEEIRTATTLVLMLLFGGAALLILGSTIVGRDLSEGRLGFYFSRPISGWTLWWSRLAAALVLIVASLVLIVAPSAALDPDEWSGVLSDRASDKPWPVLAFDQVFYSDDAWQFLPAPLTPASRIVFGLAAILAILTLTHAVSTLVRARSVWVLADLAGLAAVSALGWSARDHLVREQALGALVWAERLLIPGILAALLIAGGVQLTRGRTDLALGHRYLSAVLWPLLIAGALTLVGYAHWIVGGDAGDLDSLARLEASPAHDFFVAGGHMKHRAGTSAAFLVDARSGDSWRLGSLAVVGASATFSGDGSTLVWLRCDRFRPLACRVWRKDLRSAGSPALETDVELDDRPIHLAVSQDGSRLAVAGYARVSAYELSSGQVLGAAAADYPEAVTFVTRNRLRFHQPFETETNWVNEIWQLDLDRRQKTQTGRLPRGAVIRREPVSERVLYRRFFPPGTGLYRGDTGALLVELHGGWSRVPSAGEWFADGRLAIGFPSGEAVILRVLDSAGEEQHRIERYGAEAMSFAGEVSPGRVLVALLGDPAPVSEPPHELGDRPLAGWSTYLLDADSGALELFATGAIPFGVPRGLSTHRLFLAGGGEVLHVDLATGESRTVLPAPGETASPVELTQR